ncbi:uncharacterized protein LOC106647556 [Copidosoma floridanum]|uniref:uncharacterized protein LOC106647556 n=1 Tax=Copidosoma floridanum TaxID=29053 RepID=UPI0006C9A06A|nr:uncharacterized protein LOC106647556 [Copidosoma floridanum]
MTQANRKRGRDMEEENGEFMPLSKRINNLHLNNLQGGGQENLSENMESHWGNQNFAPSPNHSEPSQGSSSCDGYSSSQSSYSVEYRPELSASENPYYYENNKLLYNLHMERMQRTDNHF